MARLVAHHVKLSVFAHEDEDADKIASALKSFIPDGIDWEKDKLSVERTVATGAKDNRIIILQISLGKRRHVSLFLDLLKSKLSDDQRALLLHQADSRLDEGMNFFIRIDKRRLLEEDRWWITDSGRCFHIKITLAAYPAKKEVGLGLIKEWLG